MSDFPGEPLTGTTGTVVPSWKSLMIGAYFHYTIHNALFSNGLAGGGKWN
jgi:hypothetical protein